MFICCLHQLFLSKQSVCSGEIQEPKKEELETKEPPGKGEESAKGVRLTNLILASGAETRRLSRPIDRANKSRLLRQWKSIFVRPRVHSRAQSQEE